jgi:uncharacterized membrane protein
MSASGTSPLLRGTAIGGLAVAWAIFAHRNSVGGTSGFSTALAATPIVIVVALLLRRLGHPLLIAVGALAAIGLLVWVWPQLRENGALLHFVEHVGTNLAFAVVFGRTLAAGHEPLITQLARFAHPEGLSPIKLRYTRQVTVAWTAFFIATAAVSTGLFLLAPAAVWSVFANFLTLPLILLMFAAEHLCRYLLLPSFERGSIADTIRAFRAGKQGQVPASDKQ